MSADEQRLTALNHRLGLRSGLLIGITLAVAIWLPAIVRLVGRPAPAILASILLAQLIVVAATTGAGWLSTIKEHPVFAALVWLIAGFLVALVIAYQPYQLKTLVVWISSPRFFPLAIYPAPEASITGIVLAGFFILFLFFMLGLLQPYRFEGLLGEWNERARLSARGWSRLLLPLPAVFAVGVITYSIYSSHLTARPVMLVDRAIKRAAAYEGDLFALGRAEGLNYAALNGVRDQLHGDYALQTAEVNADTATTTIVAHFENGAWIYCRVINEQLNYCYDASPPYTLGLRSLVLGEAPPADCLTCNVVADSSWEAWLTARRDRFGEQPDIHFLEQRGKYVLMSVADPAGDYGIECLFSGTSPVTLQECTEIDR